MLPGSSSVLDVNLTQLEYFLTAARLGSLSAAAEDLMISQPSVSEQVRKLERDLGATLFVRTNRNLVLTPAGRRLIPEAENALNAVKSARAAVEEADQLKSGTVSFGVFASAHRYILKELVADLMARYPAVEFRLSGSNSGQVADAVTAGEYDAGLVMTPVDDRELNLSEPLLSVPLYYWSANAERVGKPMDVRALAAAPLVMSEARWGLVDPLRVQLEALAQRSGVDIRPKLEVEFQDAAIDIAAGGDVDVIASAVIVDRLGLRRVLKPAPIVPTLHETIVLATRRGIRRTGAVAAFEKLARKHFAHVLDAMPEPSGQGSA